MRLVYKEDLDQVTSHGCTIAGCTHDHDKTLFMAPKCCRNGVRLMSGTVPGTVRLLCAECLGLVLDIAVEGEKWRTKQTCHPGPLDAAYTNGSGQLAITCRMCHRPVSTVTVSKSDEKRWTPLLSQFPPTRR